MDVPAWRLAFVFAAAVAAILAGRCQADFIRVQNGVFVQDDCREWYFSGYNTWQPIEMALDMCCGGRDGLNAQFAEAARNNMGVVRFFGFPAMRGFNLQTRPGQYTEQAFVGIDRVIAAAADHGVQLRDQRRARRLKVLIALTNNWNYNDLQTDWKCSYTNWSSSATQCDDFFSDRGAIQAYKDHARAFLGRVNTLTGRAYSQDETVFGWNLINEPRSAKANGAAEVQAWVAEVAPFVKALAPRQLVTIGEDGFYQAGNCEASYINPVNNGGGGSWPMQTGQDFLPNHLVDGIDFAAVHLWPDNWARTDMQFSQNWLWSHLVQSERRLGKPLVLEEYGKDVGYFNGDASTEYQTFTEQWQHYRQAYNVAELSLQQGRGLKGIMFWHWAGVDDNAPNGEGSTIFSSSGVWRDIIVPFSGEVAAFNANASRPVVPNCVPVRSAAGAPAGAQGGAGANPSPGSGANPRPANTAGRRLKQIGGIDPGVLPADTANAAAFPETASAAPAPTTAPGTGSGAGNVAPGAAPAVRTGPRLQWAASGTPAAAVPAVAIDPITPVVPAATRAPAPVAAPMAPNPATNPVAPVIPAMNPAAPVVPAVVPAAPVVPGATPAPVPPAAPVDTPAPVAAVPAVPATPVATPAPAAAALPADTPAPVVPEPGPAANPAATPVPAAPVQPKPAAAAAPPAAAPGAEAAAAQPVDITPPPAAAAVPIFPNLPAPAAEQPATPAAAQPNPNPTPVEPAAVPTQPAAAVPAAVPGAVAPIAGPVVVPAPAPAPLPAAPAIPAPAPAPALPAVPAPAPLLAAPAPAPAAPQLPGFLGSTFRTPAGLNAGNVNAAVTCGAPY